MKGAFDMFNNQNAGYSLADIAAATGGANNGWGGEGFGNGWWIILLFLFAWGGWGNGGFGFGGNGSTASSVAYDFDISDLKSSIAANGTNAANGFYALNTGLLNGFADVTAAVNTNTSAIRSDICAQELAGLQNTTNILQAINADTMANMQNTFGLTT
jgi:hypothetical protein